MSRKKPFEDGDPMEIVGVSLPEGNIDEMAECLVEDYIRDGWDDESLLRLFRKPFFRATHRIYEEKGEAYVLALIARLRQIWGYWDSGVPGSQDPLPRDGAGAENSRCDEVKKQILGGGQER
jgi:hypothetical protein